MCFSKSTLPNASCARKALLSPMALFTHWVCLFPGKFPGNPPDSVASRDASTHWVWCIPGSLARSIGNPGSMGAGEREPTHRVWWSTGAGSRGSLARGEGVGPAGPMVRLRRHHRTRKIFFKNQKPNGSFTPTLHELSKPLYTHTHYGTRKPSFPRHGCHR